MDVEKINAIINENKKQKVFSLTELHDYQYEREIYELLKMEISNYIISEINTELRTIINKILANNRTSIKDILSLHIEHDEISNIDIELIKKIYERPESRRVLDDNRRYDFDGIVKNKIIKLFEKNNVVYNLKKQLEITNETGNRLTYIPMHDGKDKSHTDKDTGKDTGDKDDKSHTGNNLTVNQIIDEVSSIILSICEDVISVKDGPVDKSYIEGEIRKTCGNSSSKSKCENSMQCMWSGNTCKLVMNRNDYVFFINMLVNDFIFNDYVRESIIFGIISPLKQKFLTKADITQKVEIIKRR